MRFFRSSSTGIDPISGEQIRASEEDVRRTISATERTRRGWFGRMSGVFSRSSIDDELWDELEEILLGADTGLATAERILDQLRERASAGQIRDPIQVKQALRDLLVDLLKGQEAHGGRLWSTIAGTEPPPQPAIILVVGVNGVGKTTSIAKLAHKYIQDGARVMLAAGDTFRAAAIDQLREWGDRVGAEVIAQGPNSDPGAVTFDALTAAAARGVDVLMIDTAGRLHTKFNLMEELRKVRRVIERKYAEAPHEVLLVLDATTGQNGLAQARTFAGVIGVTSILLTKLDGTSKGGIVFAVTDELGIPVRFVGTGETVDDLAPFVPEDFVDALFAE